MASGGPLRVELTLPDAPSVAIEWDPEALRALGESGGAGSPWRLEGEVDWQRVEGLRVVSAAFEDGALLGVAALRPSGAVGHDAEAVAGMLMPPELEVEELDEALISIEFGADGEPRRLGLELYEEPDSPPIRVAANRRGEVSGGANSVKRRSAAMEFLLEGRRGSGSLEVVTRD